MGIIRGGLFVISCVLLLLSFLTLNFCLTLERSLEYNEASVQLNPVLRQVFMNSTDTNFSREILILQKVCQNNTNQLNLSLDKKETIPLSCDLINQGEEAVINYTIDLIVSKTYYRDYNCSFWDCAEQINDTAPFFLVSENSRQYWQDKFYWSLIASLVLIVLVIIFIEKRINTPFVVGGLLVLSSLPFIKLPAVIDFFSSWEVLQFLDVFFTKSYSVFYTSFAVGVLIILVGVILKIFKLGFKLQQWAENIKLKKKQEELEKKVDSLEKKAKSKKKTE